MNLKEQISRIKQIMVTEGKRVPRPQKNFLYHGTHIDNLESIQKFGLLPEIGETVKSTSAYQDYEEYGNKEHMIEGILFFSDNPDAWAYSQYGKKERDINQAILVIVKKNESIFRKTNEAFGKIVNTYNEPVRSVNHIPVDSLPIFIERGDYFSFEEQEPYDILHGDRLKEFLENYFGDNSK